MALFTQIKVKTVLALVSDPHNRHHLTPVALDILSNLSPWLHNQFYTVSFMVVTSYLEFVVLSRPRKVAILAETKVVAICADEASADDGPHVAADALVLVVCC